MSAVFKVLKTHWPEIQIGLGGVGLALFAAGASSRKVRAIALNCVREELRKRILYFLVLFGIIFIFASRAISRVQPGREGQAVAQMGLFAVNLFGMLVAVFSATTALFSEIRSRTIFILFSHPVSSFHIILGKFLGVVGIVFVSVALMGTGLTVYFALSPWWFLTGKVVLAVVLVLFQLLMLTALCVLGSATPSLESWARARAGRWTALQLPERATPHPLPEVQVVDLREEEGPPPRILSAKLRDALADRLERGEQSLLLLNRRGHSTWVSCESCGWIAVCRSCNVSLTWHRKRGRLVCHHCAHEEPSRDTCPECGSGTLAYSGVGTEQVERHLGEVYPDARIARMDVDTTGRKWSHRDILDSVRRGEVDILLGTQMISKGLDLPGVTLVGVIDADVGLNLPDFRASERTFQLLSQVAGRAGRGRRPGEVLVQTARPSHFAIQRALVHDYAGFAERELADREEPGYPPHLRLANLVISGRDDASVEGAALALGDWLEGLVTARPELAATRLLGPAPCPIDRLRGRWRWHLLIKQPDAGALGAILRFTSSHAPVPSGVRLEIDRDPESLL